MTEFLKNNPIALRYCLLYEFLQGKSASEWYSDICRTIGDNVINKEELQLCFIQFELGIFDDYKKLVPDIREIFRSDKKALRACVMYEWLSTKSIKLEEMMENLCRKSESMPVFEKYEKFCKVLGEDVMEYREFEFWFYRFVNGEFELDFQIDENKNFYELMDLPIDVINHIVQYLDIFDRINLMKTSRSLQKFIVDQKLYHQNLRFNIGYHSALIGFGKGNRYIQYGSRENRTYRVFEQKARFIQNVSYWSQAMSDFETILKTPKLRLDTLEIDFSWCNSIRLHFLTPPTVISTQQAYVKHLFLNAFSLKPLLRILPMLKPGYLTTINISTGIDTVMDELVEMEQWKQAKYFTMCQDCFIGPLDQLYHFKEFDVRYRGFSVEDIHQMKEILFNSNDFEKCTIRVGGYVDMDAIGQELGDAIPGNLHIYHYRIPNSTQYFEIKVEKLRIKITRKNV